MTVLIYVDTSKQGVGDPEHLKVSPASAGCRVQIVRCPTRFAPAASECTARSHLHA